MGPTIIIGLGGFGSEVVALIESQMNSLPAESLNLMKKLMRFAIVDTDVAALRKCL